MIENIINTKKGNVFYYTNCNWSDDAKTIVFVPGLTADHTMFLQQEKAFWDRYNLILIDPPMQGKSRPYFLFEMNDYYLIFKEIFKKLNIKSAVFVGQSLGSYCVQSIIKRRPEMVEGFISIGGTPYGDEYYSKSDFFWLRQIEWMCNLFPEESLKKEMARGVSTTECCYENMYEMVKDYSKKELSCTMKLAYAAFMEDNCDIEIKCPVELILGDHDKVGKVTKYNKQWTKNTNYKLHIIENAGHNTNVDNAKDCNKIIDNFMQSI